jgi:hypothetical protein
MFLFFIYKKLFLIGLSSIYFLEKLMRLQVITKRRYILDIHVSNKNSKFQYYMELIFLADI